MLYAIVLIVLLIFDQALKLWTTNNIVFQVGEKTLIPGVIGLTNWHNEGAAFGFLPNFRWLFVVLCIAFCVAVIMLIYKKIISGKFAKWAAVVTMAGAIGNAIDRLINGYVVDMLEFKFFSFPIFNLADCFITIGGVAFCLCILFEKPPSHAAAPAGDRNSHSKAQPARKVKPSDPFASWEATDSSTQDDYASPLTETIARNIRAAQSQEGKPSAAEIKSPAQETRAPEADTTQADAVFQNEEDEFDINSILDEFRD